MLTDRRDNPVIRPHILIVVIHSPVAGCQHDLVILEYRMLAQLPRHQPGAFHPVKQPEGVLQFIAQFPCGKRETCLKCQCIQEFVHGRIMHEPAVLHAEEFVQIKRIFRGLSADLDPLRQLIANDLRHLVGIEIQFG